ncbi:DUF1366 domain-containing protein [Gemella sp. zg-1178]|uniref:DUF1366 domain-containing protein n=1 Tax=Gemella sp. zg-1178 TaxID=2840372 RepID=UPI001C04CF9B|nr:DUF1366 domain-containing protein [Gemella sp. zg-1178]MBU0279221.1 DUF1366 domain-containing protein [Gemella sp. zg-1178]
MKFNLVYSLPRFSSDGLVNATIVAIKCDDFNSLQLTVEGDHRGKNDEELVGLALDRFYELVFPNRANNERFDSLQSELEQIKDKYLAEIRQEMARFNEMLKATALILNEQIEDEEEEEDEGLAGEAVVADDGLEGAFSSDKLAGDAVVGSPGADVPGDDDKAGSDDKLASDGGVADDDKLAGDSPEVEAQVGKEDTAETEEVAVDKAEGEKVDAGLDDDKVGFEADSVRSDEDKAGAGTVDTDKAEVEGLSPGDDNISSDASNSADDGGVKDDAQLDEGLESEAKLDKGASLDEKSPGVEDVELDDKSPDDASLDSVSSDAVGADDKVKDDAQLGKDDDLSLDSGSSAVAGVDILGSGLAGSDGAYIGSDGAVDSPEVDKGAVDSPEVDTPASEPLDHVVDIEDEAAETEKVDTERTEAGLAEDKAETEKVDSLGSEAEVSSAGDAVDHEVTFDDEEVEGQ